MQPDPSPPVNSVPAPGGESKSFLTSKTFWILLCGALLAPLLKKFGIEFNDAAQQQAAETIVQVVTAGGALWARSKATGPLNFKVTPGAVLLAFSAITLLLGGCETLKLPKLNATYRGKTAGIDYVVGYDGKTVTAALDGRGK